MVKQIIQLGFLSLALSFGTSSYSQIRKEKAASKNFERLAYSDAIAAYKNIADKGKINRAVLQNLADAYYFNGKLVEANTWYAQLIEGDYEDKDIAKLPAEYYYRYAQTLKSVEEYKKSNQLMDQFSTLEPQDSRVALYHKNRDYIAQIEKQSSRFELQPLNLNSNYSDYGGTILGDQFIFTSARATDHQSGKKIHTWTSESFTQLYTATIKEGATFESPVVLSSAMDSKVNDATAVFTKDGNTMYFTRNNSKANGKSKQNKEKTSLLKLYKAVKQSDGKWGLVEELPINSENFNTAHPALTPDDAWLYFSSDREGTLGQSDLFRVALGKDGTYGTVENLGKQINTEGRESFPFISADNHLYFSSDGHPGLGGLDVFVAPIKADGSFGPVSNVGKPINSNLDDFGFYLDTKQGRGFVSSNRVGGTGGDDIYYVTSKCQHTIEGTVYDKDTKAMLSHATVKILNVSNQQAYEIETDAAGYYKVEAIDCGTKYSITASKEKYNEVELILEAKKETGVKTVHLGLEKQISVQDDLFKTLQLKPIYFDFDKSNIRKDASVELMKVVEVMKKYPTLKLDVRSHTDSRGNDAYNMSLSDRRVKATMKWIIQQGIDSSRLTGKGYGESQLLNNCSNGVPCKAADHQLNRRSEFIILEI